MADKAPIAVALDAPDLSTLSDWAAATAPFVDTLKVGLESYLRDGEHAIAAVRAAGTRLFLDLKLHHIPNTVAGACRSVARFEPDFLTVHASGGAEMVSSAAKALPGTRITAVTMLTSLSEADLVALGINLSPIDVVVRWAKLAVAAGAGAIVCSPQEVAAVRAAVPSDIVLITPGVRPLGADLADQQRVATPESALASGADLVVIGRPITGAPDVAAAAKAIGEQLGGRA